MTLFDDLEAGRRDPGFDLEADVGGMGEDDGAVQMSVACLVERDATLTEYASWWQTGWRYPSCQRIMSRPLFDSKLVDIETRIEGIEHF